MDEMTLTQLFAALFTPEQQVALTIITMAVVAMLEGFKNIYFGWCPTHSRTKRKAILWTAGVSLGVAAGVAGYFVGQPPQPLWFWMFAGASSGFVAITGYKIVIDILWPVVKAALKPAIEAIVRKWIG